MTKTPAAVIGLASSVLSLLLAGCLAEDELAGDADLSGDAQGVPNVEHRAPDALASAAAHPSAVHLLLDGSVIRPWCGGVLVAPDVVVTSTDCVAGIGAFRLEVGLKTPGAGQSHRVERVVELDHDPRLAALVLDEVVEGIEPVSVVTPEGDQCDVQSISYRYVAGEDEPLDRWVWSGCYTAETQALRPRDGEPNCHGDSGAPAFDHDGDLLGVVVAASGHEICIDEVVLAVPDSGAYDEALELSR